MVLISLGVIHSLQSNGSLVPFVQRYWECRWVRILVWYNNQFRAHNLIRATLAAFFQEVLLLQSLQRSTHRLSSAWC